ncbi:MAG: hypothetical protein ACR2J8_07780, partial [Thermomicrobiales bacterium]
MTEPAAWERLYRRTIDAYYEGALAEGQRVCDQLLSMAGVPGIAVGSTRRNMVHYAPVLRDSLEGYRDRPLLVPLEPGWSAFNPSIAANGDGFLVTVRTSNYIFEPPTTYYPADGTGVVRTKYQLLDFDADLRQIGDPRPLVDLTRDDGMLDILVRDNEDLRPFRLGDRWLGTAATWRRMNEAPHRMIRYGLFDLDLAAPSMGNPRWLSDGSHGFHEKNWMPAVSGGELFFLYAIGPTIVLRCDPDSGTLGIVASHPTPGVLFEARGGPPLLPFEDGFLTLSHEVSYWENGARAYLHRLIRFGPDFAVTHATHPFRFHGESIEYAIGLAQCRDRLVATFGTMDHDAWMAELPLPGMLDLLQPVADLAGAPLRDQPIPDRVTELVATSAARAQRRANELETPREPWEDLLARSIQAYYEGQIEQGALVCDWLMAEPTAPDQARANGRNNAVHYAPKFTQSVPGYSDRRLDIPLEPGWQAVNPTIARDGDGLVLLIRATNWSYPHSGPHPDSGIPGVRSHYWVQRIDANLEPLGAPTRLDDRVPDDGKLYERISGNEDYRLFRIDDQWMASASAWRLPLTEGMPVIRMGLFDLDLNPAQPWVGNPRWLSDGTNGFQEKNWMPAVDGSKLFFIYGSLPTSSIRCDIETGRIEAVHSQPAPSTAGGFRGGTQLLPNGDGWIALVHEFATWEDRKRTYLHRVIRYGPQFNITHMSLPFRFRGATIEFAAGLARIDDRFFISFVVDDTEAWVASVPV